MKTLSDADLLRRLVSFDTTSHLSNLPMAELLSDYLDRPGVRIERNPSPDGDKANLVVTVGGEVDEGTRQGLVLCGHMDVVPAIEPDWHSDPFELTETDTRYVGRGSCDMKGFVALAVNAAARVDPIRLRRPLVLLLTYDEELGTLGARHFVDTWPPDRPLPRPTIVGEPTSLRAVRMHKGHASVRLTFHGLGAHSGYPHLGRNAIEPAGRAIGALAELRRQLEAEPCPHGEHFGEVPFVALSVSQVHGGTAVNIVPDRCVINVGFRVLPGMEAGPIGERIQEAVTAAVGDDFELGRVEQSPPLLLEESNDLYATVCGMLGQTKTEAVSYATDGGWFQTAGLDCLIWGPGNIDVAHKPNEWMPKDEYARASQLLEEVVERYCVADGSNP